jgi:hypothetical protein
MRDMIFGRYEHDGTHSHPWSATPAAAIATGLMGVRPTVPGWAQWRIKPAVGNLTRASIVVPTPRGAISANISRGDSGDDEQLALGVLATTAATTVQLQLTVPNGTEATVCLPLYGLSQYQLRLDGVAVDGRLDPGRHYVCLDHIRKRYLTVAVQPLPRRTAPQGVAAAEGKVAKLWSVG